MGTSGGTVGTYVGTSPTISNLDYLIIPLRLHLGDTNPALYRYLDEWLRIALVQAVKDLQRWWNYKYLVNSSSNVYRNTEVAFTFDETLGLIQEMDEKPIILMASLIIKGGQLENNSWNVGSWRDAEISYSNIEGGKEKGESLKKDWDDLTSILTPPSKRLVRSKRQRILNDMDYT